MLTNHRLTVAGRRQLTEDVVSVELSSPNSDPLPDWTPGAHVTVHISESVSREYSLCGGLNNPASWTLAVRRCVDSRGGSSYVHDRLDVGTTVTVTGPRNHFELADAPDYVFIAAGIGITPILPMIEHVHRLNKSWSCVFLGRTAESMPFRSELVDRYPGNVEVHTSHEGGRYDIAGLVNDIDRGTAVYACGPESLICDLEKLCQERDLGLHVERFTPKVVDREPQPFDVEIAGTDTVLHVPADRSMLDVLYDADLDIMSSCEEGTCGTCEVRVVSGVVDHRDSVLTPAQQQENSCMMPCVSRSCGSRLVIEL